MQIKQNNQPPIFNRSLGNYNNHVDLKNKMICIKMENLFFFKDFTNNLKSWSRVCLLLLFCNCKLVYVTLYYFIDHIFPLRSRMFFGCDFDDQAECDCNSIEDPHLDIKLENSNKAAIAKECSSNYMHKQLQIWQLLLSQSRPSGLSKAASKQRSCGYKAVWNIRNTFKWLQIKQVAKLFRLL